MGERCSHKIATATKFISISRHNGNGHITKSTVLADRYTRGLWKIAEVDSN